MGISKSPERSCRMLPSEALKALRASPDLALLIDRRGPSSDRIPMPDMTVEAIVELPDRAATAYLVKSRTPFGLPA